MLHLLISEIVVATWMIPERDRGFSSRVRAQQSELNCWTSVFLHQLMDAVPLFDNVNTENMGEDVLWRIDLPVHRQYQILLDWC